MASGARRARRARPVVAGAALVAALLTPTAPAQAERPHHAGPRADLAVTSVGVPRTAVAGSRVRLTVKVRNGGSARAGRTTTSFALSADRRVGRDTPLRPGARVGALRPGRSATGRVTLTLPRTLRAGRWYVLACADAGRRVREGSERDNCRPSAPTTITSATPPPPPPPPTESSHGLIDADLADGKITAEQALTYRVFADFADPRLPGRYVGTPNGLDEGALADAAQQWASLSAATQETLRPFLVPPFYAGSHWSPAPASGGRPGAATGAFDAPWCSGGVVNPLYETWDHLDSTGGDVRVWWLRKNSGDAAQAAHVVDVIENHVLPALGTLMGTGPKPDGGGLCDGGSDALDIALVDASTATTYADGSCGPDGTSAHMLFPRSAAAAGWTGADPYLAHEVMHAIQFAMPTAGDCASTKWLREMTAQWVQDYVTDPAYGVGLGPDDTEQKAAPIYLDDPGVSLEVADSPAHHDYGDYLLAQWAVRRSSPAFVRDVWDAAATRAPRQAIDHALPGGFEDSWADFALSAWNKAPAPDFATWDGLSAGAAVAGTIAVGPTAVQTAHVPVKHLANQYVRVDLDPKISELEIEHDKAADPQVTVRAVLTYSDGSHRVVTLDQQSTTLCIDDGTKHVTELVLILSDADLTTDKDVGLTLTPSQVCGCPGATARSTDAGAGAGPVCQGQGNVTFTYTEDVVDDDGEIDRYTQSSTTGSLDIVLLQDPDDPTGYYSAPESRYEVHRTWAGQVVRHAPDDCGDEDGHATEDGSGPLPEGNLRANTLDGQLWVINLVALPTRSVFDNDVTCIGHQHDEMDSGLSPPTCPVRPPAWDPFYEADPVTPGSSTYTFSCTSEADYADGIGRHHVTATVSLTLTLPD